MGHYGSYGAFTYDEQGNSGIGGGNAGPIIANYFNASNYNSVYTNSGKVYPLSLALNYVIKC